MIKRFKRVNYFDGQVLGLEDLLAEQSYMIGKLRLHNRISLGAGVVEGLEVWLRDDRLIVEPGLALDCMGRELVLAEPVEIFRASMVNGDSFVLIHYQESESDPVPTVGEEAGPLQCSRIVESVTVTMGAADFITSHRRFGDRYLACNREHAVPIARIREGKVVRIPIDAQGCATPPA